MRKTRIIVAMLLLVGLVVVAGRAVHADAPQGAVIETGCVGDCGEFATITHQVPERDAGGMYGVEQIYSSLCPNQGAEAEIYVNNEVRARVDLTDEASEVQFTARPGDVIDVVVDLFDTGVKAQCIWLGDLQFALTKLDRAL